MKEGNLGGRFATGTSVSLFDGHTTAATGILANATKRTTATAAIAHSLFCFSVFIVFTYPFPRKALPRVR
jgi:hypothetical protein